MLGLRVFKSRRWLMAALSFGLIAAFMFGFSPPSSEALVSKTDGLHMSRSDLGGTYYGCLTTDCPDTNAQILNSINSATTALGTRTIINFDNDTAGLNRSEGVTLSSDNFHLVYRGYFYVPTTATYHFGTASDDMSYVWLGSGATNPTYAGAVVKNQGVHGRKYASGSISLEGGKWHPILVLFGERGGGAVLDFYWSTTAITTEPSTVPTLSGSNFRHSGATFYTAPVNNPGTPGTAIDASTASVGTNSFVTGKSTLTFTGTTVANSNVEYSWSTSSGEPSSATGQCSVSSTTYTCTISDYTGDTRYLRVRAYDDYSNYSSWTTAVTVEGKLLMSLTNIENPILNRPLSIQPRVQLRFASANQTAPEVSVTASISSGATLSGSRTVTTVNGAATFTDLQVTGGTPGDTYTITYSSSGYLSATDSFTLKTLPTQITISSSTSSNGGFENGVWYANSATPSVISASALATELAARNVTLEAQYTSSSSTSWNDGSILFHADVSVNTSAERTISFRASKNVYFNEGRSLSSTNGKLNVILWSDTDSVNAGMVQIVAGTDAAISTRGGHIAIGGGSGSTTWNGLTIPSGRAAGNTQFTASWFGVELYASTGPLVSTAGGDVRILGTSRNPAGYNVDLLYGVYWDRGQIATGSGSLSIEGVTGSDPSVSTNPNYGVVVGANASSSLKASYLGTGGLSIVGSTATTSSDHRGVSVRYADLDAGSSTVTISSDRRVQLLDDVTVKSRFEVTSEQNVLINGAQSWTGSAGGKSAVLTSTVGSINIGAPITSTSGLDFVCNSGTFTNTSAGTITAGASLDVSCSTVTVGGVLSASGNVQLESQGASSVTSVNANLISDTAGGSILVKSKSSIITANSVLIQTVGRFEGVGGNIVLWSDSDANGQGFIRTGTNVTMNSIGGSESTSVGGGHIHLAGGSDDGSTAISALAVEGDGLPDGWAISTSGDFGVEIGSGANVNTVNKFFTGGGDLRIFGKATQASDAIAFNWATIADSGIGQMEIVADSSQWGIQINRNGDNNPFTTKSRFVSRSDSNPAISFRGSTTGTENMALLGSWGDAGRDNLTIQSVGDGGIELVGSAPSSSRSGVGFTSTSILSKSGNIKIDGGSRGVHLGLLSNGQVQGQVQLGSCPIETCPNSLVTSSSADIELIGNRVTSFDSLGTTVDTSGVLSVVPAVGSTAFVDFQSMTSGLTLDPQLGGLVIGREGDNTNEMRIQNNWTITGPISVHAADIYVDQDIETTGLTNSPIRLRSLGRVYTNLNVDLVTNGSDIVFWSGAGEAAGQAGNPIYISNGSSITTNGGKIWLAGGLDDGGTNALITASRGKWSSVVADDGLPDGYASGFNVNSEWDHGVLVGSGVKLLSGGGDIFIAGSAGPSSAGGWAHIALYPGAQIDSGTGRIAMWGRSFTGHSTQGIAMPWGDNGAPVMVTSNASSADAITIYSDSSAGASWSRGIIAYWYGALDSARGYQGSQILATASGGGITMTGIGSAAGNTWDGPHGLYLDFIDILAIDGPITLNGDGGSSGLSMGAAFGWRDNPSAVIRLGGWASGDTGTVGGGVITTPGGVTADFTNSSSDVTINVDTFWNRQSSNGMLGVYVATSGDFKILPVDPVSGIITPADNFRMTQSGMDWSFEKLRFQVTPESIQIGRPSTSTAITVAPELRAHGAISVYGSALNFSNDVINESGRGPVLLKSTSSIALAASRTYQTNGSDLVFWASSGGGNGSISVGNAACINTNASCDVNSTSTAAGNIYFGGGSAGTNYPTGPVTSTDAIAVSLGTGVNSGIKILSGSGSVSMRGSATNNFGISFWSGFDLRTTTGSIEFDGSSNRSAHQGFRIAESGTSTISSGKTSGDAIAITGFNGSNNTTVGSNGIGLGYSATAVNINATGGGDIRMTGTVSSTGEVIGSYFGNTTVTAAGGDVLVAGDWADLNSTRFDVTNGGSIQIKSTRHIELTSSTLETSGPVASSGGEISVWADSDGDNVGHIHTELSVCINTINSCTTPANSGGADIVLGGGSVADVTGFFPAAGAPASSTGQGIRFGNTHEAGRIKLFSGGGDIAIRSKSTSGGYEGQYWYGGTNVNAGTGAVSIQNAAAATSTSQQYAVRLQSQSADISITSAKPTGTAITFDVESGFQSTNFSSALLFWNEGTTGKTTISATGGGDIDISATASGTGDNKYSVDMNNVDVLATSGDITIGGNRGVWINRGVTGVLVTLGATPGGSATGDIVIRGNRFVQGSGPLAIKTSGTLTVRPLSGQSFIHTLSFPNTGINLTGISGLNLGAAGNTANITMATASSIAGNVNVIGGLVTVSANQTTTSSGNITITPSAGYAGAGSLDSAGSLTISGGTSVAPTGSLQAVGNISLSGSQAFSNTTAPITSQGSVRIEPGTTAALNANITAGSQGILVKSVGRVTTSTGTADWPRTLSTNSGPITLWTTGAVGGVTLSNHALLDSNSAGAVDGGGDITIGGGDPIASDPTIPGGNAASNANSGIILGTSNIDQIVRVLAGAGDVVIRGESTASSTVRSGIAFMAGVKIIGGTVHLFGKAINPTTTNNTASGIFHYQDSATAKTLIEATKDFQNHTTALSVRGETSSGSFGMMLSNVGDAATVQDAVTIRTTGANADIEISGSTGASAGYSVQAAGLRLSTATGDVLVDSGDDAMGWSRAGATRKVTYVPVSGEPGGNITLRSRDIATFSTGSFDVDTAGLLKFEPPVGQSFTRPQIFPLAGSVIDVGGLVVGSANNTANLTQGAAVTSSGDVKYLGGAQSGNFAITTSGTADIAFYPTTTFAKSTPLWSAGGDILIGIPTARATTVTLSTSTLSAGGDLRIFSSQNVTQSAAISAGGGVTIDTSGASARIDVRSGIAAGVGGILLKANQDILFDSTAKNITTSGGGDMVFWANASGNGGEVDTGGLSVVIDSNGGDIVIAGGADDGANGGTPSDGIPDNSVVGRTADHTIRLSGLMDSDAGNITIRAQHSAHSTATAYGAIHLASSARIRSTTGDISIVGTQNSGNTSASNQYGIWLGESTVLASRATVSSTSGDIFVSGDSSQSDRNNRRGVLLFGVDISTGGNLEIFGKAPLRAGASDVLTWAPSSISAAGTTLIGGAGISHLESTSIASGSSLTVRVGQLIGTAGLSTASFTRTALSITGSGSVVLEPRADSFTATQSLDAINFDSTLASLRIGKVGNLSGITVAGTAKTISGNVTTVSGSLTTSSAITSSAGNVAITADSIDLGANLVASSGITTLTPQTVNRAITVGTEVANTLSLTSAELGRITTGTLRLNTDGNVNVTASLNLTGKVANLAIRAGGNVTGSAGVVVTVANLGIDAGGTISFPANQVATVIALSATGVSYTQDSDYSVAAVDGIDPEFGFGVKFALANVPTIAAQDAFMNVAFNPPPTARILDKFNNVLQTRNLSAADFAVTPTLTVVSSAGSPVLSGATPTRTGGTFAFDSLNFSNATGTVTLTFAASRNGTPLAENSSFDSGGAFSVQSSPTFTTGTYNIQAGEPASIAIAINSTTAPAGKTGFGITATLKDTANNTIASGPHAEAAISVSIAGTDGTIVSGNTPATAAGIANFSDLVIGGKVATDYTLTFSVTYIDTTEDEQTVRATQVITLTPGDATKLGVSPATQSQVTGQVLTDITVSVLDAYDNVVTSSNAPISIAMSAGSNGGSAAFVGYSTPVVASSGQVVFNTLGINGTAGDYTLTFSSGSLTAATHVATMTHSVAHRIDLVMPTTAKNDVVLTTQPVVTVYDVYDNVVLDFTGSVALTVDSGSLGGNLSIPAVAGVADFAGLGVKLIGVSGDKTVTATAASISRTDTAQVTLSFGPAVALELAPAAAGFVNRVDFATQPEVKVVDSSRNTVENFAGDITVAVSGSNIALDGTTTISLVDADNGVKGFSGLSLRGAVASYTLTYSSGALTVATQSASLTHGAAFKLTLSAPADAANDAVFGSQPIVSILDEDNNPVISGPESTQVVTLSATGATLAGVDAQALAMPAVAGVANFTGKDLKLTGIAGPITLTAAITSPSAISKDATVTLGFGAATKLAITTEAVGFVNRTNFSTQPKITVQDVSGNTVTNFAGDVELQIGANARITGTKTLTLTATDLGVANFAGLGLEGTAGNYTITAKSDGLADATQAITLSHGVATKVELTAPATITNNTLFDPQPSVRILDADGNLVSTGADAVQNLTLTSNATLNGTATITTANGVATFSGLSLTGTIGSKTLTATSSGVTPITGTANTTILFGAATKLAITTEAVGFVNRTNFTTQPIITVQDVSGNTVTNFAGDVELQIGANASITGTSTLTLTATDLGVANFAGLGLEGTAGNYTITAKSTGLADATQSFTLTHGAPSKVVIVQSAAGTRSGQLFDTPIQLQVQDADGNVTNTGDGATAQITVTKTQGDYDSGGADFGGTLSVGAIGGVATFSDLTLSGVAGDYDLSFAVSAPGALTGFAPATQTINLLAGSKNSIAVVQQPTNAQAGVAFSPVVTVQVLDAWNNRILADSTSVVTAERVSPDNATNFGTVATATAASGLATFSGMQINKIDEFKLRFTSNSVATVLSDNFTVAHGPASKLAFVLNPVIARSDVAFTTQLRLLDEFDNAVTTGPEFTVTSSVVSANSANVQALTGNQAVSSEGTEVLFFSSKLKAPVASYQLRYTATDGTNTFFIDSNNIALGFGLPSQLNIATPAATARAGEVLGTLPIVEIQDSAGNLVANSTLRVTASVAGRALVGTAFVDAVGGVANFSATGLGIAGTVEDAMSLQFAIEPPASNIITETQSIDLVAGPARYLHILQEPTELVTRETFSPAVAVQLRDQYQNPVLSDSTTSVSALLYGANNEVATATAGEPAIAAISQQANAGVMDFSALSFAVPPASGYYIKFALPSDLDVVNSAAFKVVPGAVASITIDQQPSTTNQDNSLVQTGEPLSQMPQVSLYDQDGYLADNAVGSVTLSIASGAGGDLSEGSTSATIAAGHADFVGVKLVGKPAQGATPAEQYTLQVSFAGVNSPATNALVVTHNVAHRLVLQREAANGRAGDALVQQPIVEIQDRYNNIVESSNAAIRVGPSAGGSVTGREVNAQSGIATFRTLALGGLTTNTYSLTYEIPNTTVATVQQTGVTLSYGFADRLLLTTAPVSLDGNGELTKTGDVLFGQPVIKVFDAHNNIVENSNDIITATFISTFDARDRLENAVFQAVNGVASFQNLKLIARPGQDYRLSFGSGTLSNAQSGILRVRHANAHSIEILTQPSAVIDAVNGVLTRTGNALHIQPEIRILDFDRNHADSAAGVNVVATVSNGGGGAVATADENGLPFNEAVISGGLATFSELKLVAIPGVPQELSFSAAFATGSVVSVATAPVTLTNGLARALAMHVEPCAGVDDGTSCAAGVTGAELLTQPVVKVLDEFGNVVVDHVGDVVVSVSAAGARLAVTNSDDVALRTVSVLAGFASFDLLELTANPGQPVKLNFASAELTGVSSRDLVVAAGGAARIEMVVNPVGERTGNELSTQPKVKLVDRFGNTVLSDSTTQVTVTASGGNLFTEPDAPLVVTADQGEVSFAGLRFTGTPGADFTLEFTAPGVTAVTSASFRVTNAFADDLVITQQPVAGKTGDLLTQMPILELKDFDGNLAEDDNETVVTASIDVSNGAAAFVDAQDQPLGSAPSFTADNGVIRFTGIRIVATPGTVYKLNFTATPEAGDPFSSPASQELVFAHANPAQLVVTQSAIGGLAGEDLTAQPELEIRDRFGNKATGDSATILTVVIETGASGDVLRGATGTAVNGEVRFAGLALDGVPAQTYTLGFNALSEFGASFRVVDAVELTLSRPATLTLSMAQVAYVPDMVVTPVFTTDSAGVVTWSTSSDPGICVLELDGSNNLTGNVLVKGVGTCSLRAEVARFDFTHTAAPQSSYLANQISTNLVITQAVQATLSMTSLDNVDYRGSITLASAGGSGTGLVSFFVTGDCRVIGGVLLPGEAGAACSVFARKAGDANYLHADSATQSITINRIAQSILSVGNAPDVAMGDIQLFTSGGTGTGAVSYQPSDPGTAQCQIIDGNILRATQNGTCRVMATKQSSTNYLIAISPEVTFTFSKMSQTVNFNFAVPVRPTPGTLFEPTAVASSGLAVTIAITGGAGVTCEFDATETTKVRFLSSGNCVLTASQSGSSQFNSASSTITIAADLLNQAITFDAQVNRKFGDPKFQLAATASSGLPVSYAVGTGFVNPGCMVSPSGMVTLIAAGMCEIVASQAGNASYAAAKNIIQMFTVAPDQAGAPHLVSVAVSNQAITAKFRAPSYLGGSQVSAYRLEATDGDGDVYVNPGCAATGAELVCDLVGMPLTKTVDNQPVPVSYTIRLAAVTAAGIGLYSESSPPVTPRATDFAVMKLSADQVAGQLRLTWEQPLALDGAFVSYDVFVWPANTDIPETPTQSISSVLTESANFTMTAPVADPDQNVVAAQFSSFLQIMSIAQASSYNLKVVTITTNSSEAMTDVNVATGTQIGLAVPARPRNEILEADSQQLRVVWSEPTSDGGAPVTHYMIRKAGDDAPACELVNHGNAPLAGLINEDWNYSLNDAAALLYQQQGLAAGSSYEIAIFACNEIGASAPAILTHSIPAPPAPFVPAAPVVPEPEIEAEPETEIPSGQGKDDEDEKPSKNPTPKPVPTPGDLLNPGGTTEDSESPAGPELPGSSEPIEPEDGAGEGEGTDETLTGSGPGSISENNPQPVMLWILLLLLIVALRVFQKIQGRVQA